MSEKNTRYVAKTMMGMEPLVAEELKELGARNIQEKRRAVFFEGDLELLYRANLELRCAVSILKPLFWFRAHKESVLYKQVGMFDWMSVMDLNQTFAITSSVHSEYFNHSKYVALKAKDAIVDMFRDHLGERPNVDPVNPDIKINIHVNEAEFDISLDSSGDGLHKRGYRQSGHGAPLNEVLAAGMIKLSGWTPDKPFLDPMCGSGTLPIEACMVSTNTPANILRKEFGFMNWKNYDEALFLKVKKEAMARITKPQAPILGTDGNYKAIEIAEDAAKKLGFSEHISFQKTMFNDLEYTGESGVIIMNPPYGERLNTLDVITLYKGVGDKLKSDFDGFDAWIISSNKEAFKNVGLRPSRKTPLMNGPLECKFIKYEMYRGSKKAKFQITPSE
ncbi:MAG: THUMP domain-containing protein [Flavobacteriales bacterium]